MRGYNLKSIYLILLAMGLVRSKRQFSREWLLRGWSYLREFDQRDRDEVRVPAKTVAVLRARLRAVARLTPGGVRTDLEQVIAVIDRDTHVADLLSYGRNRQ
ncbi:hypothetical protein ASF56_24950 [Methylobacterium sp. Leaf122]|nr:hypothetical protein ASF56_24950 [Methylobacterium sp. Leaf122]